MSEGVPGREEAFSLLKEYNQNEGLIRHALAVERSAGRTRRNGLLSG